MSVRVLYDAGCGFCTRSVETLVRLGASAAFTPLQTADLETLGDLFQLKCRNFGV